MYDDIRRLVDRLEAIAKHGVTTPPPAPKTPEQVRFDAAERELRTWNGPLPPLLL
jgi:hypothetical protein